MTTRPPFLPLALALIAMLCLQFGASLAKGLFDALGAEGATTARLVLAALLLLIVYRPWRGGSLRSVRTPLLLYGVALGVMNLAFYLALTRVPMGIVVAVEFLGPLGVAIATSRRPVDFAWVGLAVAGLGLLLPLDATSTPLDPVGIGYALLAAVGWALYILFGRKAGADQGGRTVAIGMAIAAIVVLPPGIHRAGAALFDLSLLPLTVAVAVLSSALPYVLEMYALTRMPTRSFGILMSVEPAIAALMGLAMLGESLTPLQWLAIAAVMVASMGSALTSARGA